MMVQQYSARKSYACHANKPVKTLAAAADLETWLNSTLGQCFQVISMYDLQQQKGKAAYLI